MKKRILPIIFLFFSLPIWADYAVKGGSGLPLKAEDTPTIMEVYLLNGLQGAEISFESSDVATHQWYRYSENANNAEPITSTQVGNRSYITDVREGYGYFVGSTTSPSTRYVWIIDYSKYVPVFISLIPQEEEDKCESLQLITDMEAEALRYYTATGVPLEVQRIFHLQYRTMTWEKDALMYVVENINQEVRGVVADIVIDAPLIDTDFTLVGDQFAEHFGVTKTIKSNEYQAIAVKPQVIIERKGEIFEEGEETGLGGSAPIDIKFTAYSNEPVTAFYVWYISKIDENSGEATPITRFPDKVLNYTFAEEGKFEVKLEVFDRTQVCVDDTSNVYNIDIAKTFLFVPNAFSPGSSIGVNDVFKVSYRSITNFKASIFNRWGNLLYQWTDPDLGWDGRVHGKFVPTGAYYYVIEYKGADGKKHTKSGDVNILRAK